MGTDCMDMDAVVLADQEQDNQLVGSRGKVGMRRLEGWLWQQSSSRLWAESVEQPLEVVG